MKKRAFVILMTVMLGSAGSLGPACCVLAQESGAEAFVARAAEVTLLAKDGEGDDKKDDKKDDKGILEQGQEIGEELYQKLDEAVSGVDKKSLRKQIRQALREMDEMGISPTIVAKNLFGIGADPGSNGAKPGAKPGNTLIEDAQKRVKKTTEGFFSVLWNGFLDTLEGVIETGFSILGK